MSATHQLFYSGALMKSSQLVHLCRRFAALVFVFAALAGSAFARFSLEQIMSYSFPNELHAAENAGRIAWVFNQRGVRNIWIADAPNFAARQVTHYSQDDGQALSSVRLTPDGRTIVYVRGGETNRQGEVPNPTSSVIKPDEQVWAVDVDSGQPRMLGTMECGEEGCEDVELSPDGQFAVWAARNDLWIAPVSGAQEARRLAYVRGDNTDPRWSPDDRQIAFVSHRGDHALIGIYDFGRSSVRYLAPSVDRDMLPRWSPDGKQIAFVRIAGVQRGMPIIPVRPTPWRIMVADVASGRASQVWHSGTDENGSFPRLSEDDAFQFAGNRLVFSSEQDSWNHLYSIPAAGGNATLLTPGQFDVEDVILSRDRRSLVFSSNQGDIDRRHLWRVSIDGGTPQALTKGETIEWSPVEMNDGKTVVCLGSTATLPAMPYRVTANGREMIARDALPADFPSAELVTPQQVVFNSEDGLQIHGQLFVPKGRSGPGAALVFMHGGPVRQMVLGFHYMGYYHNAYAANQYLASLGYVVLSVNYRTGIMYGRAFRQPKNAGWRGASEYQDIVAAGKYLRSLPTVDKTKIGLWGGSYGGYLTAMGLARNSDIFAAGVDLHGVHDWTATLSRRTEMAGGGGAPDMGQAQKLAFESSPNASIAAWKSPVLLIQGDDDRNVAFSQTVDLVQRLREAHVPYEQLVFPDEIHDFLMWRSWVRAYDAAGNFFDRVLKRGEKIASDQ